MKLRIGAALLTAASLATGCYSFRPSSGGAQSKAEGPPATRSVSAADVALPVGYTIEPVLQGLTFPTGIAFDQDGALYVVEAGYSYGESFLQPRLLKVQTNGNFQVIAAGATNGPWTGVAFHEGNFIV